MWYFSMWCPCGFEARGWTRIMWRLWVWRKNRHVRSCRHPFHWSWGATGRNVPDSHWYDRN